MRRAAGRSRLALALSVVVTASLGGCGRHAVGAAGLDAALAAAAADGKAVMAEFSATWCEPCKRLESTTFADARVRKWLDEHVHVVRLDLDEERGLAGEFAVTGVPAMVFLRADRSELGTIVGYRGVEDFLAEAERRLAGVSAVAEAEQQVTASPGNARRRREYFAALRQAGRNDEALEQAEKYWELSRGSMSEAGVRGSFFLTEMDQLANGYHPARLAMRRWYDEARQRLLADEGGSTRDATEFALLAKQLRFDDDVIAVLDQLDGKRGARTVAALAGDLLVARRRYDLFVASGACSKKGIEARLKMSRMVADSGGGADVVIFNVAAPVEALGGVGRVDDAMGIVELALAADDSSAVRRALLDAAQRSGSEELLRRLRER